MPKRRTAAELYEAAGKQLGYAIRDEIRAAQLLNQKEIRVASYFLDAAHRYHTKAKQLARKALAAEDAETKKNNKNKK